MTSIEEGNKLIAGFMGGIVRKGKKIEVVMMDDINGPFVSERVSDLKYHSSWDWLKPAIDKIHTYSIAYPEQAHRVSKMKIVVDIQPAWLAVVEFIRFRNTQTPSTHA